MKKYPKVGDTFYWMDDDSDIHEDICQKIEEEDNPDLETMFFTYISSNGGGTFVTESDLISSNSKEVKEYLKKKAADKLKEIAKYISQEEVYEVLKEKLIKHAFTNNEANKILNILTK